MKTEIKTFEGTKILEKYYEPKKECFFDALTDEEYTNLTHEALYDLWKLNCSKCSKCHHIIPI